MSEVAPPPLGSVIDGRYRLARVIGTGGVGVVYEAEDLVSNRKVAIKVLRSTQLAGGRVTERLRREARAIKSLRHPNVVEVLDIDVKPELAFLAMELLEGESLGSFLRSAPPLSEKAVAVIGRAILDALVTAHEAGLVHRDVKPDNVFLAKAGASTVVKLLDFGLVKSASETAPLTATGTVLGTFQYMAPEQAHGLPVDGRADVYSTAACLYYALVRQRPYQAAGMEASMFALSEVPAPPLAELRPGLDPELCRIVEGALQKSLDARPTARDFMTALERFIAQAPDDASATDSITEVAAPPVAALEGHEPTTERDAGHDVATDQIDETVPLAQPPVKAEEIAAPRTVPLARVSSAPAAAPGAAPARAPTPAKRATRPSPRPRDTRVTWLVVVALLLFGVGVLVGRTFIFP